MLLKEKRVKLTKIGAIQFGENHPNGINTGYVKDGVACNDLEVGSFLMVACNYKMFYTSTIIKIDEEKMTFETENSIYKIELIDEKQHTDEQQ